MVFLQAEDLEGDLLMSAGKTVVLRVLDKPLPVTLLYNTRQCYFRGTTGVQVISLLG